MSLEAINQLPMEYKYATDNLHINHNQSIPVSASCRRSRYGQYSSRKFSISILLLYCKLLQQTHLLIFTAPALLTSALSAHINAIRRNHNIIMHPKPLSTKGVSNITSKQQQPPVENDDDVGAQSASTAMRQLLANDYYCDATSEDEAEAAAEPTSPSVTPKQPNLTAASVEDSNSVVQHRRMPQNDSRGDDRTSKKGSNEKNLVNAIAELRSKQKRTTHQPMVESPLKKKESMPEADDDDSSRRRAAMPNIVINVGPGNDNAAAADRLTAEKRTKAYADSDTDTDSVSSEDNSSYRSYSGYSDSYYSGRYDNGQYPSSNCMSMMENFTDSIRDAFTKFSQRRARKAAAAAAAARNRNPHPNRTHSAAAKPKVANSNSTISQKASIPNVGEIQPSTLKDESVEQQSETTEQVFVRQPRPKPRVVPQKPRQQYDEYERGLDRAGQCWCVTVVSWLQQKLGDSRRRTRQRKIADEDMCVCHMPAGTLLMAILGFMSLYFGLVHLWFAIDMITQWQVNAEFVSFTIMVAGVKFVNGVYECIARGGNEVS